LSGRTARQSAVVDGGRTHKEIEYVMLAIQQPTAHLFVQEPNHNRSFNQSSPRSQSRLISHLEKIHLKLATGTGKSTQVVQYIAEALTADVNDIIAAQKSKKKICCIQPRREPARKVSAKVSTEFGCKLGEEVGFHVGGNLKKTSGKTCIEFVTAGLIFKVQILPFVMLTEV
jgi:hypothetical protein